MILSGSMSSWIEENIISSTGYFGRVELDIVLKELPLYDCNHFWEPYQDKVSSYEKFKVLCVTGGVPRYLESIDPKSSAEENIRRLFYRKEGLFFKEFDRIFSDLYASKSPYKKIVGRLAEGPAELEKIYQAFDVEKSGVYSDYLDDLEKTGYVSRDFTWKFKEGSIKRSVNFVYAIIICAFISSTLNHTKKISCKIVKKYLLIGTQLWGFSLKILFLIIVNRSIDS